MFPFAGGLVLNIHRFSLISIKYFLFFLISALAVLLYCKRTDKRAARKWAEVFSTETLRCHTHGFKCKCDQTRNIFINSALVPHFLNIFIHLTVENEFLQMLFMLR